MREIIFSFGTMIKKERIRNKYSQVSVAKQIEISVIYYCNIENNKVVPTQIICNKIIEFYGLDYELYTNIILLSKANILSKDGISEKSFWHGLSLLNGFRYIDDDGKHKFRYEKNSS